MDLKIISYNVNGLRAALTKGFLNWLQTENPDIICIQETKLQQHQIDEKLFQNLGYHTYWHSAVKKGYSSVAIFSKLKPDCVEIGMNIIKYDCEGRILRMDWGEISILCTYFPSGSSGDERQAYKMEFLDDFLKYIHQLKQQRPNLIICGDHNICHKNIDINHPEKHQNYSGFLPEERKWFDSYIEAGFVDTFRLFNNKPNIYSWWSYRAGARPKNLGWRIDYNMVSQELKEKVTEASILTDVFHSDHCPVRMCLRID